MKQPRSRAATSAQGRSAMEWARDRMQDPVHRADIDALMTEMNLEQDLIALRESQGLTQVQLAEAVGVSQPVIARIEGGKARNIELRTLVKLAAALGERVTIKFEKYDQAAAAKPKARRKRQAA